MPIPGSPTSVTNWTWRVLLARSNASSSVSSSRRLPTSGVRTRPEMSTPTRARASTASQACDRLRLALRLHRLGLAVVDRVAGPAPRRLADEDAVHRCVGLKPRRSVDDVAGHHALALLRPRTKRHERLPGVDADAELELGLLVEDPVTDRERGAYGALCVVLVRHRRSEDRHHRIADELLYRAAEALELVPQAGVVGAEQRAHLLRIHLLGARREAHEIGEEDGDDLALFEARFLLGSQRPAAGVAESRIRGVLLAAAGAGHARSLRRPQGYSGSVAVVLITGMSGTGKSAALAELERRGHRVVDTDYGDWIEDVRLPDGSVEPLWNEERIDALLSGHSDGALFVVGTVANQGKFYPRFDAVVLLSAPLEVVLERVATRESNPFGKTEAERDKIADDLAAFEPLLRAGATTEIDTRKPLADVVDELEAIAC